MLIKRPMYVNEVTAKGGTLPVRRYALHASLRLTIERLRMGGKFSRNKGRRNEQALVLHLANRNYKAERILRQYLEAGQPDVVAWKDGKTYTFEAKMRKDSYKSIYKLYYEDRDSDGLLCFCFTPGGRMVAMSTDFEQLISVDRSFRNLTLFPPAKKFVKVYERIIKLHSLLQKADYLVIKDNGKPNIFIRYW